MEKFDILSIDELLIGIEVIGDTLQILYDLLEENGYQGRIRSSEVDPEKATRFVEKLPKYLNVLNGIQNQVMIQEVNIREVLKTLYTKEAKTA